MTQPAESSPVARRRSRGRLVAAAFIAGLIVLIGGIVLGRVTSPSAAPTPSTTSAEAGFARDMQTHHHQAVQMSMIIRAKTEDPDLLTLSYDIATAQGQQAGQMYGWLTAWGLPQASPEPAMTWMTRPALDGGATDHKHGGAKQTHVPGERMPGLATQEQIADLTAATGTQAEELFLELMIAHHEGGIDMADAVIERSENEVVLPLARGIATSQQSETKYMRELLAAL